MSDKKIFYTNIETETINNSHYRHVLFTSAYQQIVVMSIKPNQDIHLEKHRYIDQFIRIEQGKGELLIGENSEIKYDLSDGIAFVIPSNTWHRIVNTSATQDLKLYTIYSPPNHKDGKIDIDRPDENVTVKSATQNNKPINQIGGFFSDNFNYVKRNYLY